MILTKKYLWIRFLLIFLLQCFLTIADAQTGTIYIKKSTDCDFELKADSSLLNKSFSVYKYAVQFTDGGSQKTVRNDFFNRSDFKDKTVLISKKNFENKLQEACDMKDYKILNVIVRKSPDFNTDNTILIVFKLKKK